MSFISRAIKLIIKIVLIENSNIMGIKEYNSIKENAEKQKIAEEIELLKQFKQFVIEKNNTEIMEDKTNVVIRLNKCKNKIRRKENE